MWLIPYNLEVGFQPAIYTAADVPVDAQLGKFSRLALNLHLERVDMIEIDMGIAHGMGKSSRCQIAHMGEHMRQQGIGSDIERDTESHIARALVQQRMQDAPGPRVALLVAGETDVELGKHVARRESHFLDIGGVPGAEDDSAVVGFVFEFVNDFGQLIDALAGVVVGVAFVVGAKVAPLEAVDGAELAFFVV